MRTPKAKIWTSAFAVSALAGLIAACQQTSEVKPQEAAPEAAFPYVFSAPGDWRTEIVTFRLSFAPELDYEGHGDVRFAPGMFDPETDEFWTYSFVW